MSRSTGRAEAPSADSEIPEWTVRPFCRNNTQSEPEDYCHSTEQESEEEELECLRCCTEYYYCSKRGSAEIGQDQEREGSRSASPQPIWSDSEECDGADGELMTPREALLSQSVGAQLAESFRLVFFVALPMLARQIGSILSRRLLARLFGPNTGRS